jgi:AcrR family transcriptional regulator
MVQKMARPRGRPRSFDPDEVLAKARAVFWNLGYAATSLDDIAAATGLNRPSLYAAFGDKHALYMAALARTRREAGASLEQALATPGPLRSVLGAIFDRTVQIYTTGEVAQRGCFLIGTAVTQAVDDPAARQMVAGFIAETDGLFRTRFEEDRAQLAPGVVPDVAAAMASGTFHTLGIRARTGAGGEALKRLARGAIDMICGPAG